MTPRLLDLAGATVVLDEEVLERLAGRSMYLGTNGYVYFSTHKTGPQTLHAFALGGSVAGMHIDHINGDKLDNRRANLRVVTPQRNQVNRKVLNRNNTSGIRGVAFTELSARNPWRAQITANGRAYHLGLYPTAEAARAARVAAEIELFGEVCP